MNKILVEAYKKSFGKDINPTSEDWEIAEALIRNFNVPAMGETLAKLVIFQIVLYVSYPSSEKTREVVGDAELLATELWPELNEEPHMDEIEFLEFLERRS